MPFFVVTDDEPGPVYVSLAFSSRWAAELQRNRLDPERSPRVVEAEDREHAREIDEANK